MNGGDNSALNWKSPPSEIRLRSIIQQNTAPAITPVIFAKASSLAKKNMDSRTTPMTSPYDADMKSSDPNSAFNMGTKEPNRV